MTDVPSLTWVLVDDLPRQVSDFVGLPPRRRPVAICTQCGRRLTLKLGNVRQHHAAHAPGDVCAATHAETALHIDCKFAIAAALHAAKGPDAVFSILRSCAGEGKTPCNERLVTTWLTGWDDVSVEQRVGDSRRPDLVLHREGTAIGAIEIVVSNPVSPEKAQALAALSLPWIEVLGDARVAAPGGWAPRDPLPVARVSGDEEWRCPVHAAQHRATLVAADEQRAAQHEANRRTSVLRAARVVDVYHQNGVRDRFLYRVTEQLIDGAVSSMHLRRGGQTIASVQIEPGSSEHSEARAQLRLAFAADVKRLARPETSFADSPMRWATGDVAENIVDEALVDRYGSDPTPLATTYPRRWFYVGDTARWFLPPDMRDARWDREPLDVFAAHPAWTAARTAVRERPAPAGSWQTPVFASRPIAAMFLPAPIRAVDGTSLAVVDLPRSSAQPRRAIVVIEHATPNESIAAVARSLARDEIESVWLSHPLDWCEGLAPLVWATAGRDARGHGGIVVDGLGIYRASHFLRAWSHADDRLSADAIRRCMAPRVDRMRRR